MTTKEQLQKLLEEFPVAPTFTPYVYRSKDSGATTVYLKGDADYSETPLEGVTLYRSMETNEIIGFRLEDV